ncbi:MAG: hypothetical protein K2N16_10450, partial [Muribaculaceae bacterium]|nr:hypothetical protein [Muribaculaceae bacterium]
DNVLRLTGEIRDRGTDAQLPKTHWAVYDSLDCLVDSATARGWDFHGNNMYIETAQFSASVPRVPATYRLVFAKEGYDTTECYYTVKDIRRRELTRPIGTFYLSRTMDNVVLDAVTVTASKVKFYNKGDTIVFNADAFQLAEGSMLDELVRQLPGVEIKDGGAIYVNGRYVESLLLNGKDFFKGNNNVMLNNLAAYTVKDIQVYDKRTDLGEFLGTESESEKEYVMDVKLKKDYNGGWMINAEGGYGTNDRYLGRLFVANFNSRNRFTFIGNTNNLGSNERPGQDRGMNIMQIANGDQSGRSDLIDGGIDYYFERDKKKFTGNTYVTSLRNNLTTTTSAVNFLPQGNNYSYSRSKSKTTNLKVDSWHFFGNSSDYLYWQVTPSYHYANSDGSSAAAQALFNSELSTDQWTGLLGRLMAGDVTPEMRDSLINQSLRTSGNSSIRNHASTQAQAHIKFRGSSDYISSELNANYVYSHLYGHNRYLINYGDEAIPGLGQKQRTADRPDREYSIAAHAQYNYVVDSKTTLSLRYGFSEYWHDRSSNLYMAQIQAEATGRFDLLALEQMKETLDAANSFESHDHNSTH